MNTYWNAIRQETVVQQQAKLDTFVELVESGLPVPQDIEDEIRRWGANREWHQATLEKIYGDDSEF